MKFVVVSWVIFITLLLFSIAFANNQTFSGIVIDKWTVTKRVCYFEEFCPKITRYFISLDSIYDDIETTEDIYKQSKKGESLTCNFDCKISNEMNIKDK